MLFVTAAGAAGQQLGIVLVLTFIVGLLLSNSTVTFMSTFGFIGARKNTRVLMTLGSITAVFSLIVGTIFLLGQGGVLPALLGG